MIEIDIQQMQAELERLIEQGVKDALIIVTKGGDPMAHLHFSASPWSQSKGPRAVGLGAGTATIHPSFYEPLPPDLLAAFNGENPEGKDP